MSAEQQRVCPTCQGEKIIEGVCQSSSEWHGTGQDEFEGMHCTPDQECPTCQGTGYEK